MESKTKYCIEYAKMAHTCKSFFVIQAFLNLETKQWWNQHNILSHDDKMKNDRMNDDRWYFSLIASFEEPCLERSKVWAGAEVWWAAVPVYGCGGVPGGGGGGGWG